MILKFLILIAVIIGFSGCVGETNLSQNNGNNSSLPQWYIQAPSNSNIFIYGVGEGKNLQEARNLALNDMASRLSVSVKSNISQFKQAISNTQLGDSYEKKVTSNLDVEVEKINFSNAQIEQSTVVNNTFFVLIKANKSELIQDYESSLKLNDSLITKTLEETKTLNGNEKIFGALKIAPLLAKATSQAILLSILDNSFNSSNYILKYQDIEITLDRLKANLTIEIKSNLRHGYFLKIIETLLKQDGYQIVQSNADLKIELNNIVTNKREMAWQNIEIVTNISTIVNNRTIFNSIVTSNAKSSKSEIDAILIASKSFEKKIKAKGIESFIFSEQK